MIGKIDRSGLITYLVIIRNVDKGRVVIYYSSIDKLYIKVFRGVLLQHAVFYTENETHILSFKGKSYQ
jgi:hypothetical protein